jgi:pimeloyl-ACP methyl ester carboxylesterase
MAAMPLPNRQIAIDTPGFGGSFHPKGWPSLARYADDIVAAIDRLGVRRAHWVGHHTGGCLAAEIATRHPRRTDSVTLLGPVAMTRAEQVDFRGHYSRPIAPKPDGSHLIENWTYAASNNAGCDIETIHGEVVDMLRAWRARPQAYRAVSFHDTLDAVRRLKCPLLLMTTRGDFFYPRFDRFRAARPDAAIAITPGANFPALTHGRAVARAIAAFMRKL